MTDKYEGKAPEELRDMQEREFEVLRKQFQELLTSRSSTPPSQQPTQEYKAFPDVGARVIKGSYDSTAKPIAVEVDPEYVGIRGAAVQKVGMDADNEQTALLFKQTEYLLAAMSEMDARTARLGFRLIGNKIDRIMA